MLVILSLTAQAAVAIALSLMAGPPPKTTTGDIVVRKRTAKGFRLKLLVLRHSKDGIAVTDARGAAAGLEEARKAGLDASLVGDVDVTAGTSALKGAVEQACKHSKDTTLIVHTIGHGFPNGTLQNLGHRSATLKILSDAATKHKQRIVWWQLSCYAMAGMPKETGNPRLVVVCSSPAHEVSRIGNQSRFLRRLFVALTKKKPVEIDSDDDGVVSVTELADFLNKVDHLKRGSLIVRSRAPKDVKESSPTVKTITPVPAQPMIIFPPRIIIRQGQNCPT